MIVLIGYLASAFLAFSLITVNAVKFRWLNIFGCISFIVYGVLIAAFPVILANVTLLGINIYQLVKMYRYQETFSLLPIHHDVDMMQKFLSFYKTDIQQYFPEFDSTIQKNTIHFFVLRDMMVANLFAAHIVENGIALVDLNYTIPQYRDFKIGTFIFIKEKEYLLQQGVRKIVYEKVHNKNHQKFLEVTGFKKEIIQHNTCFVYDVV
jgi:predicted metalloendopeptidase